MAEAKVVDYRLFPHTLINWLRDTFGPFDFNVEQKNCHYVFNLPDGQSFTSPSELKSTLACYQQSIQDQEDTLFNPEAERIDFLEVNDGHEVYKLTEFVDKEKLPIHLLQNRKDPRCRFLFIKAAHSRAPLSCSWPSFSFLFSFHQVSPKFLDYVFSFGATHRPLDYNMTGFHFEDSLDAPEDQLLRIPELGRSGRQLRMQYLLRSVERGLKPDGAQGFNIRQMAIYHSFDFSTGKALWINVKANRIIEDRIKEAVSQIPAMAPSAIDSCAGSFIATLTTHLIHVEWCDEDWRQSINDIEKEIQEINSKAQTARINQQSASGSSEMERALSFQSQSYPLRRSPKGLSDPVLKLTSFSNALRRLLNRVGSPTIWNKKQDTSSYLQSYKHANTQKPVVDEISQQDQNLKNLETFSFNELQRLHHLTETLESFELVMELDRQTLNDIAECYKDLWDRDDFPLHIKDTSKKQLRVFLQRIERTRKNLLIRITQVRSLIKALAGGRELFSSILQYRNVQIGRIFTESSHVQSRKMERIAVKTENETISMHVITCVTLAFLPTMFLATFFQSGLVTFNEGASHIGDAVKLREQPFRLFASICFPMMAATFLLWIIIFKCLSRRARKRTDDEVV